MNVAPLLAALMILTWPSAAYANCEQDLDFQNGASALPSGRKVITFVLDVKADAAEETLRDAQRMNWMGDDDILQSDYDYDFHGAIIPINGRRAFVTLSRRVEDLPRDDAPRARSAVCSYVRHSHSRLHGWFVLVDDQPYGGSFSPKDFR